MKTLRSTVPLIVLLCSSCRTAESGNDWSWVGGLVGGIIGFGLFFLVNYLILKGRL